MTCFELGSDAPDPKRAPISSAKAKVEGRGRTRAIVANGLLGANNVNCVVAARSFREPGFGDIPHRREDIHKAKFSFHILNFRSGLDREPSRGGMTRTARMTFESRFNDADIEKILGEYWAGADRRELCARNGISTRTLFRWNASRGRNRPTLLKLVSSLHEENERLRRMLDRGSADSRNGP